MRFFERAFSVIFCVSCLAFSGVAYAKAIISWPAKSAAIKYVGEISSRRDFKDNLLTFSTKETEYMIPDELLGKELFFRIRYVDRWDRFSSFSNTSKVIPLMLPDEKESEVNPRVLEPVWPESVFAVSLLPSLSASRIDGQSAWGKALLAGGGSVKRTYRDLTHSLSASIYCFSEEQKGYVGFLNYRLQLAHNSLIFGPSLEAMSFNTLYKKKGEIVGALVAAGGELGWQSANKNWPKTFRFAVHSTYNLKGYFLSGEYSQAVYKGEDFGLLMGINYRRLSYKETQAYELSLLGFHVTFEKF